MSAHFLEARYGGGRGVFKVIYLVGDEIMSNFVECHRSAGILVYSMRKMGIYIDDLSKNY